MPASTRKHGRTPVAASARPEPRTVLLHFHIFKNAGTTLDEALRHAFGPAWAEVEGDDPNRPLDWAAAFRLLESNPALKVLSSHTARFPAPERPGIRFLPLFLIRHPIDRLAAIYFFEKQNPNPAPNEAARVARAGTLADFMQFALAKSANVPSAVCDAQTSWLARSGDYSAPPTPEDLVRAKAAVESAIAPGVVERTDVCLATLEATLTEVRSGLDLAAPDRNRNLQRPASLLARLREVRSLLPPKLCQELAQRNRLDLELWRFTNRLALNRFSKIPDAPARLADFRRRKAAAGEPVSHAPKPAATNEMPWTGERLVPAARGDFVAEHLHRYALAAEFAAGCEVLDVGCGEGYGSAILAQVAGRVTGVDSDAPTIAHAAAKYKAKNLRFVVGRAEKLPLPDHSVDLVVSFETLEHLDDHQAMLGEIKRVLKPKGQLLISTPDCKAYQVVSGKLNPFHVRELNLPKFKKLLAGYFRNTTIGLQKSISGSWVVPMGEASVAQAEYSGDIKQVSKRNAGVEAPYLVAMASDAPVAPLPSSFFNSAQELVAAMEALELERKNDRQAYARLEAEFGERTAWARMLERDLEKTRDEVRRLQTESTELTNWARSLDTDVHRARAVIADRNKLVDKLAAWAKSLENDLRSAQGNFEKLSSEYADRTAWAKSLEDELTRTRGTLAERDRLIEERSAWGLALEHELAEVRSEVERLQGEHKTAVTWGLKLEDDLRATRTEVDRLQQEHANAVGWGQSLENELLARRSEIGRLQKEHDENVVWGQSLETELLARRAEIARLQREHDDDVVWGRSLEAELETSRREYARLEGEFEDRTAWAKSLDAELLLTKADRDRAVKEGEGLRDKLSGIAAACERLAAVLPAEAAANEELKIELCHRVLADLRRDLAAKEGDLRAAVAAARHAGLQNESAEAEVRRLGVALGDAQTHLNNLLSQTERLQQLANDHNAGRQAAEAAQRETKRELVLRLMELQDARKQLSRYENIFVCRLVSRWFGHDDIPAQSIAPRRSPLP